MITYRRNKNGREFFKVEENTVTKVLNKSHRSFIDVTKATLIADNVLQDKELYKDCTEQEFTSAYKEAFDRISLMKIV